MNQPRQKIQRRPVNGIILLNKPLGISSNAALQKVRWIFRAQKGGHTGALDPLATGLLPICLGEATKFSHYLLDANKSYQTIIQLGAVTTTADAEGDVVERFAIPELSEANIEQALAGLRGDIMQVPPMYSALKKDGRPLYELAREGIEIERPPRPVTIHELTLEGFTKDTLNLSVHCSKGTYIRTLAEDIGKALGTGAYVKILHRTQTGHFQLDEGMTIEYLESLSEPERDALLLPVYESIRDFPRVQLDHGEDFYFCRGQSVMIETVPVGEVLVFAHERFLGLGYVNDERQVQPKRLVNL
ncbi:tRNA pseudouridine(55) synthase TruB [Alkanindiges sp. WGS2144]|uniref:tRNA pseudouridine(55) synthase TruB n=1 Tax=Alkanindiges sp. WGS2144 TaxID=3366808 RepID=UPI0037508497